MYKIVHRFERRDKSILYSRDREKLKRKLKELNKQTEVRNGTIVYFITEAMESENAGGREY